MRYREVARLIAIAEKRILFLPMPDEVAVRDPLRLHKLKLSTKIGADKEEYAAAIDAVVLHNAVRQRRAEVGATADEPVPIDSDDIVPQCVAGIDTTDVRAERTGKPFVVVRVTELVIPVGIGAERFVIPTGSQDERRPASPSAHHLGGQQLLFLERSRIVTEVTAEFGNPRVKFPDGDIGPVAAQDVRRRSYCDVPVLVRVT